MVVLLKQHPHLWMVDSRLKYVNLRIDTRSGSFTMTARDGVRVTPEDVMEASLGSAKRFGDGGELNSEKYRPTLAQYLAFKGWQFVSISPGEWEWRLVDEAGRYSAWQGGASWVEVVADFEGQEVD